MLELIKNNKSVSSTLFFSLSVIFTFFKFNFTAASSVLKFWRPLENEIENVFIEFFYDLDRSSYIW